MFRFIPEIFFSPKLVQKFHLNSSVIPKVPFANFLNDGCLNSVGVSDDSMWAFVLACLVIKYFGDYYQLIAIFNNLIILLARFNIFIMFRSITD